MQRFSDSFYYLNANTSNWNELLCEHIVINPFSRMFVSKKKKQPTDKCNLDESQNYYAVWGGRAHVY